MLYDYISTALQDVINVIIVIGIESNYVRLTHVTLVADHDVTHLRDCVVMTANNSQRGASL